MPRGWLLDISIEGPHAILWLKDEEESIVKLRERFTPRFYAKPQAGVDASDLTSLLESHPAVAEAHLTERYASLDMRRKVEVVEVAVESAEDLRRAASWTTGLREVEELYDVDLHSEVRYLYEKDVAPTMQVEWNSCGDFLEELKPVESLSIEPPPFKVLLLDAPWEGPVEHISLYDEEGKPLEELEGGEEEALSQFYEVLRERDPDVIVTGEARKIARRLAKRVEELDIEGSLGRGGEPKPVGRVFVELHPYVEYGLAGLSERCIFALAPLDLAAEWAPGRLVDSRQSYEARRRGILLPERRGGYGYVSTALDLVHSDKGGLVFSPKVGLHENVGVLDFESMFPNIIVRHNISYETVGPRAEDKPGFLCGFTKRFLERRLHFKHLRERYTEGSREWRWCEQRQLALKIALVCIYGYSGCPVNRFGNVRVFQEINRIARETLVESMSIARERGFEIVYGDSDSLFVMKPDATMEDYKALAREIEKATGLPIKLVRHFKFLVLLSRSSDRHMQAARRYYGLLTDGSLFYRGIELRRRDTPPYIKELQEEVMRMLFDAKSREEVLTKGLPRALERVREACRELRQGKVKWERLKIRKRLRKEVGRYRGRPPHVTAVRQLAMKGMERRKGDLIEFIYVDAGHHNPYMRVVPTELLGDGWRKYDREKYVDLVLDAAETLLAPFGFTKNKLREVDGPRETTLTGVWDC
jgi:DNA polymerase elongation subunit (family B)